MKFFGRATKVGMLWAWIGSAGIELIWLPTAMITARLLTPEDFGITATAMFFVQLANRLTQFGFNAALVKMKELRESHSSSVFVMNVALGAAAWLVLTLASPFVAGFFKSPATGRILPVAALTFLINPIGTVPNALMFRELRYRELTWCLWINSLASSSSTIIMAWAGLGYWSLVYAQVFAAMAQTAAKLVFARWRPRLVFHWASAQEMLSFGMGIYAQRLLEYSALNLDSMTVGRIMGMETLGLYDKAFNLMQRILDRINQAGPAISFRVFAAILDDEQRFRRAYRKVLMSSSLITYPALALLALTAGTLFEVLFGRQWLAAVVPFQILCAAGAMKSLNAYASAATEAMGRIWSEVWRQALYATLIVIGVVVARPWGIIGAATAVLAATTIMTALMHTLLRRVTPITWSDIARAQFPAVLCTGALALPVWLLERTIGAPAGGVSALVHLGALVGVGAVVYLAFVLFAPLGALKDLRRELVEDLGPSIQRFWPFNRKNVDSAPQQTQVL